MRDSSRPARILADPINQRLNAYALAAGAAGVGVLALANPAEAKIVFTPARIPIVQNAGPVELDLNHDGVADFLFSNAYSTGAARRAEGFHQSSVVVYPARRSDRVRADEIDHEFEAAAVGKGKRVGPANVFQPGQSGLVMWACAGGTSGRGCGGAWLKVNEAYLALRFVIEGKIHYGWARIRMAGDTNPVIVGYAYESIPEKPILTGATKGCDEIAAGQSSSLSAPPSQPATLSLLALGAPGMSAWRRND